MPPYQKTTRTPTALIAPIIGPIEPRRRASARLLLEVRARSSSAKRARLALLERERRTTRTPARFA